MSHLGLGRHARRKIQGTQRPKVEPVPGAKRNSQIELQTKFTRDQRVGECSRVTPRVAHDPWPVLHNARCTKTRLAIDLLGIEAVVGFEPDAVVVDDADDGNGHRKQTGDDGGYPVEGAIRRRV